MTGVFDAGRAAAEAEFEAERDALLLQLASVERERDDALAALAEVRRCCVFTPICGPPRYSR